jgi:hypothetical protein
MSITVEELAAWWNTPSSANSRLVKTPGGRKAMITGMDVPGHLGDGPYRYESQILLTVQVVSQRKPYVYAPEDLDWWDPMTDKDTKWRERP